jgi:hypothetical protein
LSPSLAGNILQIRTTAASIPSLPVFAPSSRVASKGTNFEIRRRMSELTVAELPVLDLTDPSVRQAVGVTERQLMSNDYRDCRRVADLVWSDAERYGGILGPSAAKPGEQTLAVSQEWLGHVAVGPIGLRRRHVACSAL